MDVDNSPPIKSEKRFSASEDQPPVKRLKEEAVDGTLGDVVDAALDSVGASKPACPTVKRSESHGITEYVSKAHNGFFGECCLMLTCVGGFFPFFLIDCDAC